MLDPLQRRIAAGMHSCLRAAIWAKRIRAAAAPIPVPPDFVDLAQLPKSISGVSSLERAASGDPKERQFMG